MGFLNNLINGISLGSIYAVIALGYTLVYGIAKMLNFAHGDVIMVGGYVIFYSMTSFSINPYLSVLIAVIVCTVLGIVIEKVAYKPLRQATSLSVLITAIGVSYFLQNSALLLFGEKPVNFTSVVNVPSISLFDGQVVITGEAIVATYFCHRFGTCGDCRRTSLLGLSDASEHNRRNARYQGFRCGGIRRYRFGTRSYDWRYPDRCYRNTRQSVHFTSALRRYRFCGAYSRSYHKAYGNTWQEGKRKSIITEGIGFCE